MGKHDPLCYPPHQSDNTYVVLLLCRRVTVSDVTDEMQQTAWRYTVFPRSVTLSRTAFSLYFSEGETDPSPSALFSCAETA